MKKQDFIRMVSENCDYSQRQIKEVLDTIETTLLEALTKVNPETGKYEDLTLLGAKFSVAHKAARTARNPKTDELIDVPEKMVPKVKAMTALKRACEGLEIR